MAQSTGNLAFSVASFLKGCRPMTWLFWFTGLLIFVHFVLWIVELLFSVGFGWLFS